VLLIKGTIVIKGEKADVKIDPEGYQVATIFAKPGTLASLRQKRDSGNDEYIEGYGEWIQYDGKTETAILVGNAKMNQLVGTKIFDKVGGEKIHYDAITEKYKALSSTDVKSMLSPRRKDSSGNTKND
jgi:lipopolysaccharide export system protein LptA